MDTPRKITVRKRDAGQEDFDVRKLSGSIWRGMQLTGGHLADALELGRAIEIYLHRTNRTCISSSALFEMAVKALRRVGQDDAAEYFELHRTLRAIRRQHVSVRHDGGEITTWDKAWLSDLAMGIWRVSRETARILAGEVELRLIHGLKTVYTRTEVIDTLNELASAFGLADAVPVTNASAGL